ncbi:hypothetical protein CHRYSEO8AT_30201 [Chryseobacterium sp. 8AT]|nr:hypothetical protein CHRYSEO8AT_30201 [Chryseobacterium sp. 8AT]
MVLSIVLGCGSMIGLPSSKEKSMIGEITPYTTELKNLPAPKEKIVIGVYKFRDQTCRKRKQLEYSSSARYHHNSY